MVLRLHARQRLIFVRPAEHCRQARVTHSRPEPESPLSYPNAVTRSLELTTRRRNSTYRALRLAGRAFPILTL